MNFLPVAASATFGIAASVGALSWATLWPTNNFWGTVHSRGPSHANGFALTFDDGPTRDSTAAILDLLGELKVPGTFFVIGVNARKCPDLLTRMRDEGHLIANHSFDHAHLGMFRGRRYWDRQIRETNKIIEQTIGLKPAMFRPPLGAKTWCAMGAAAAEGHAVITWSRRGVDGISTTPQRILDRLVPHTKKGDVLLLHDGVEPQSHRDPAPTIAALKPMILGLRERGLAPAPLDQLLNLPAYLPASTGASGATENNSRSPELSRI
jgi:peptidoglycan/xylan/chitin deacetylase (PgdA/CDA1 family)